MRSGVLIYSLVLLLIFAGFFSSRQTVKKMEESETEVNQQYFQIQIRYFEQKQLILELLSMAEKNCTELKDSIPDKLPDITKPEIPVGLDFEEFRKERKTQAELDSFIHKVINEVFSICMDLPESAPEIVVKIKKEQVRLDSLKNRYNTRAIQHNAYIKKFPRNYYSSFYHFHSKPYYSSDI